MTNTTASARPGVIIDCDPGTDDAVALLMALGSDAWRVEAFTTVGGNVELSRATRNTLAILEHVGRADIPVLRGASRPLSGRYEYAYGFHGPGGMANTRLPKPKTQPAQGNAVDYIASRLSREDTSPRVVAVGPLTNVAHLLARHPSVADHLGGLVVMGGAVGVPDTVLPHGSEFNFRGDPLAAHRCSPRACPSPSCTLEPAFRWACSERTCRGWTPLVHWGNWQHASCPTGSASTLTARPTTCPTL